MASGSLPSLTWEHAIAWRLARHRLSDRAAPTALVSLVGDIGGLHAQLMSSAELSLWARVEGLDRAALPDALWERRALVKLWATRATLHLLPAAELGTWLAALGTRTSHGNANHPEIDALADAVGRALEGRVLTREELALAVEAATGSAEMAEWVRFSWGSYLKAASWRGLICFGPSEGSAVRFTAPATWLPGPIDRPTPDEALRAITRRYLGAYGPATPEDLTRWWLGPPLARRGARLLTALGDEVVEVDVEGTRAWALTRDLSDLERATPRGSARLLPAFDPWVVGASIGATRGLSPEQRARIYRPQGWIAPVVLVDDRITGVWRHARKARRLDVAITPFGRLPARARDQIEVEVERLAAYLGGELALTWIA